MIIKIVFIYLAFPWQAPQISHIMCKNVLMLFVKKKMYALLQYSIYAIQLLRGWFHLGINCPFLSWKMSQREVLIVL